MGSHSPAQIRGELGQAAVSEEGGEKPRGEHKTWDSLQLSFMEPVSP